MTNLKMNFPSVKNSGRSSYGGNQMLSDNPIIRRCGCGPVAALDLTLYLRSKQFPWETSEQSLAYYNYRLSECCRRYFPLIPPFGINGVLFIFGLNRLMKDEGLPYIAKWCLSGEKIWARIDFLLSQDIPVILSVGPNFPAIWEKARLTFYRKLADNRYIPVASAKSHYITATALDLDWLRIASWGQEYYIRRDEYDEYVRKHSTYLFSNIVYLKHK